MASTGLPWLGSIQYVPTTRVQRELMSDSVVNDTGSGSVPEIKKSIVMYYFVASMAKK